MVDFTLEQVKAIHIEATSAAQAAAQRFRDQHGEFGCCGFAWVNVPVKASTRLGRALKEVGFRRSYSGGMDLWNPGGTPTQSMDIREHAAVAYASRLVQYLSLIHI